MIMMKGQSFQKVFTPEEIDIIRRWETDMTIQGRRPNTLRIRLKDIKTFRIYLNKPFLDAGERDYLDAWGRMLQEGYAPTTLFSIRMSLMLFARWLVDEGIVSLDLSKIRKIRLKKAMGAPLNPAHIYTKEDILSLLDAAGNSRMRALIAVLYDGALRFSEATALRWQDVTFDQYGVRINLEGERTKTGKNRYIRCVFATPYLAAWQADYHPGTPEGENLVFVTRQGKPLQMNYVHRTLQTIARRAGFKKPVRPHLFRHSRITGLLRDGTHEAIVKKLAWGSVNTNMLAVYEHLVNEDLDAAILKSSGVDVELIKKRQRASPEPLVCPWCATINAPGVYKCRTCGRVNYGDKVLTVEEALEVARSQPEYKVIKRWIDEEINQRLTQLRLGEIPPSSDNDET